MHAHSCACACMHRHIIKNQIILRETLIRKTSSTSFCERMAFAGLGLTDLAQLASQAAPRISLSLTHQCWCYRHEPPQEAFFLCGFWGLNLDPQVCVKSVLPTEPPSQPSKFSLSDVVYPRSVLRGFDNRRTVSFLVSYNKHY